MALTLTSAPAVEPLPLHEAKLHLRIDDSDEDSYLEDKIATARKWCEHFTGRAFITQTWELRLDEFPPLGGVIYVPKPPLQSVSSITYLDSAGDSQTWDSSKYQVDAKSVVGRILPTPTESYPATQVGQVNAVTITFVAGYGAASAVPLTLKHAIQLRLELMYDVERGGGGKEDALSSAIEALLWSERVMEVA